MPRLAVVPDGLAGREVEEMQALQIRGQLDAIAGHDRRVRLELGDKRAAPTVRNDVTSDTSPSTSTRPTHRLG